MWGETNNGDVLNAQVWPRAAAMAESLWSGGDGNITEAYVEEMNESSFNKCVCNLSSGRIGWLRLRRICHAYFCSTRTRADAQASRLLPPPPSSSIRLHPPPLRVPLRASVQLPPPPPPPVSHEAAGGLRHTAAAGVLLTLLEGRNGTHYITKLLAHKRRRQHCYS